MAKQGEPIPENQALRAPSKEKTIGKYEGIGDDGIGDEGKREKRTLAARAFEKKWFGTPRQYKSK